MQAKGPAPSYMNSFNPSYMGGMFKRFEDGGEILPQYTNGTNLTQKRQGQWPLMQPSYQTMSQGFGMNPNSATPVSDLYGGSNIPGQNVLGKTSNANLPMINPHEDDMTAGLDMSDPGAPQDFFTEDSGKTKGSPKNYWNRAQRPNILKQAGNFAEEALPYLPAAYNLGMGLFGQVDPYEEIRNPYSDEAMKLMEGRRYSGDIQREENKRMFNAMKRNARNLGQSPGSYFNRLSSAAYNKRMQDMKIGQMEDQINNRYKAEEARFKGQMGSERRGAQEIARGLTDKAESNLAQYLPKAFEQFSAIGQAKGRDKTLMELAKNSFPNYEYKGDGKFEHRGTTFEYNSLENSMKPIKTEKKDKKKKK
jgi:hypothetical protein